MSYATVLDAIHEHLAEVPGVNLLIIGEPRTLQTTPAIYSMLRSFTRTSQGTTVRIVYRTRHRLCVPWVHPEQAEEEIIGFTNAIPAALCALPDRGALPSGDMEITLGEAGFVTIGGTEYRSLDFYSEAVEIARLGGTI